uniref:Uncharacterized protein n=1 Tax=Desulfacinum infernum TaxID=35837 RepID=A0A832EBQ4_9BACT
MQRRTRSVLAAVAFCLVFANQGLAENWCNHPLLPIVAGARWDYQSDWQDEGGYSVAVQSVLSRGSTNYANMNLFLGFLEGAPFPVPLTCTQTEGVRLVELNSFSVPLPGGAIMKLQLEELKGVILPPMEAIESGAPWQFVMDFDGTLVSPKGKSFNLSVRAEVTSRLKAVVPVVVPVGSFQNAHLIVQDVMVSLAFGERFSKPKKLEGIREWYLVPGVGQVAVDFLGNRTQLVRYTIPVTTQ